jgi:hypothetical protein
MKWIGQHIYDLVARFRNDVYLEDLSTTTETNVLVVDSTGKVSKNTTTVGDITGITSGSNITVTDPTGPVPTVALSTNVDVAGTLDVTSLGTFDASVTVAGNVGIGTDSPSAKLHTVGSGLFSSASYVEVGVDQTDSGKISMGVTSSSADGFINVGNTGAGHVATDPSIKFLTNSSEKMRITNTGNVGIGTATPSEKLDVIGNAEVSGNFQFTGGVTHYIKTMSGGSDASPIVFRMWDGSQNVDVMTLKENGNVGIGTTSPAQKLDVVGKISLKDAGDSIFVGYQAGLNDDASANLNVGVGYQALYYNTTGAYNTAHGYRALFSNTTGANNSAVGYQALYLNTTGTHNIAHGYRALYSNTTGASNTATGLNALYSNTTASSNTAIGTSALFSNTTGANNTAHGYQALYSNTTGSYNVATGGNALYSNTTGASNTAHGLQTLYSNTTASSNTAIGTNALFSNTTGASNTAHGLQALYFNTTGANNSAVGYQALRANTTGASNTAHGYQALYYNTTGTLNTATGTSALTYNTADSNTANGFGALYNNTTGANNSAFGRQALYLNTTGANNTAIGIFSSQKNTTGTGNAALGYAALYENTTGSSNTAIGREAGRFIADGTTANTSTSNSVFLGYNTKALADSQTNQIVIGDTAVGLGSNTAILGNSSITKTQLQGNVGIGTASPGAKLDVVGTARFNEQLATTATAGGAAKAFIHASSDSGSAKFKVYKNVSTADGYACFRIDRAYDYGNNDQMIQEVVYQRRNTTKNVKFKYEGDVTTADDVYLEFYELTDGTVEAWICHDDYAQVGVSITYFTGTGDIYPTPSAGTPTGTLIHSTNPDTETPNWDSYQGDGYFAGNVGIGTTSPGVLLDITGAHISGQGMFRLNGTTHAFGTYNSASGNNSGFFFNTASAVKWYVSNNGATDNFEVGSRVGGDVVRLLIKQNGNVGIGTTNPSVKLEVNTASSPGVGTSLTQARFYGGGSVNNDYRSGQIVLGLNNNIDASLSWNNADANFYIDNRFNNDLGGIRFRTKTSGTAVNAMTITGPGNVGIGTNTPKNKLDIVGSLGRGAPVTKTTDFTVAATENWLIMNGTATITITLPTASSFTGRELMIKNIAAYTVISASSNVKPIDTDTAATAILPATAGSWCTLVSDGTNWVTMMN